MKKTEIACAIILILVVAFIFVTVFIGHGAFGPGPALNSNIPPPSANAKLWEKAEWEQNHGGVCQCAPAFELPGPILLTPSTNSTISRISFNITLTPGTMPVDMKNTTFTVSTKNAEKTVHYDDPAVNLTRWSFDGTVINKQEFSKNSTHYNGDPVFIELDLNKMGFSSPALGPDERFSLVITPPVGYRFGITRVAPATFSPGNPVGIPGW